MILLNEFTKWLLSKKQKVDFFTTLLLRGEQGLSFLLDEMKSKKDYDRLQTLEEVIRRSLLKILDAKGEVAIALMKKDFEMNKELLAKIQSQNVPPTSSPNQNPDTQTKPRFGNLN